MMSCRAVTLLAVKLPARPLVEELVLPLLFGFTETTSKATSVDVGLGVGACADSDNVDTHAAMSATRNVCTTESLDGLETIWLD